MTNRSVIAAAVATMFCGACFNPGDSDDADSGTGSESASTGPSSTNATTSTTDGTQSGTTATTTDSTSDNDTSTTDPDDSGTASATSGETTAGAECGNGVVEAGEGCDDGTNAGADVGDCAPDCSKEVDIKEIVKSADMFDGDLAGIGPGSIIENLDDACPFGYAAMFSEGVDRIATQTPNTGDGQVDWVLTPWTAYVNSEGDLLAITDGAALLGVRDGAFMDLANPIQPDDNMGTWTGLNQDWTSMQANENCNNWTNATDQYQMMVGIAGQTSAGFLRQSQDFTYPCGDGFPKAVYCAEQ